MWYRRSESQKRFTFFFIGTALAAALGGLLASAIEKMNGYGGKRAWRWIFILVGFSSLPRPTERPTRCPHSICTRVGVADVHRKER